MEFNGTDKRYNQFSEHLKNKFGAKVYKITLDAGFSCPNRDGTISKEGCIFCGKQTETIGIEKEWSSDEAGQEPASAKTKKVQWTFFTTRALPIPITGSTSSQAYLACDFFIQKVVNAKSLLLLVSKKVTFAFATPL